MDCRNFTRFNLLKKGVVFLVFFFFAGCSLQKEESKDPILSLPSPIIVPGPPIPPTIILPDNPIPPADDKNEKSQVYRAGIIIMYKNEIYSQILNGFKKELDREGIKIEYDECNFYGDRKTAENILKNFKSQKNIIIVIGSPLAKIAYEYEETDAIPVVLLGISCPSYYGIVKDSNRPFRNLICSSYYISTTEQIKYYNKIFPDMKKLGIIFNDYNPTSSAEIPEFENACAESKIHLIKEPLTYSNEDKCDLKKRIRDITKKLIAKKKVDAILIPTNYELYSNMNIITEIAYKYNKPVFCCAEEGVKNGALAAYCSDNYKLGKITATYVSKVLKEGKQAGDIDIIFDNSPKKIINTDTANKLNIKIPDDQYVKYPQEEKQKIICKSKEPGN